MFVENYRLDTMIGGQAQTVIPYAKISDEDWRKWKAFLPVKSVLICKKELFGRPKTFFQIAYGIRPMSAMRWCEEPPFRGNRSLGKREIRKDPQSQWAYRKWRALSDLRCGPR